jgi:hypothetical protein
MKLIFGVVAFPLTWLVIAVLVSRGFGGLHAIYPSIPDAPFLTGLFAFALSALGGLVAVHYIRLARQTFRSFGVRLTRARRSGAITRLRTQRSELYERMMTMSKGIELPGIAAIDGRVTLDID